MRTAVLILALVTPFVTDFFFRLEPEAMRTATSPAPEATAIFTFHNTFWPNVHHFLHVLGRARSGSRDAHRRAVVNAPKDAEAVQGATDTERQAWEAAVAFYERGLSAKDATFDQGLVAITRELAAAGDAPTLEARAIDAALRHTLEAAAPVYRKMWWTAHRAANDARIRETTALLARHGGAVRDRITRAYRLPWPRDGQTIEMCAYANWAGAYSTTGGLIVISSLDAGNAGSLALETVFHEAMHQWDDAAFDMVREETRRQGKRVPNGLTHAMIFYTAGDSVRRVVPGHIPYAQVNGMWTSGPFAPFKAALDRAWLAWLDGTITREEAMTALIKEM
jgi:hypothetical protein